MPWKHLGEHQAPYCCQYNKTIIIEAASSQSWSAYGVQQHKEEQKLSIYISWATEGLKLIAEVSQSNIIVWDGLESGFIIHYMSSNSDCGRLANGCLGTPSFQ